MQQRLTPHRFLAAMLEAFNPPSIGALLSAVQDVESYQEFMGLVLEYLPDQYDAIKRLGGAIERIAKFATDFEDAYFPLAYYLKDGNELWGDEELGYGEVLMGIGYEGEFPSTVTAWIGKMSTRCLCGARGTC